MEKFTKMTAIAAPLPIVNVDTDMIIPKQFLKTIKRTGFGIKCVISPSFADIFYNNSFKNGILLITLPKEEVDSLMDYASSNPKPLLKVDLVQNKIICDNTNTQKEFTFQID